MSRHLPFNCNRAVFRLPAIVSILLCHQFIGASAAGQTDLSEDGSAAINFVGTILDANTGNPLAARVYVRGSDGQWLYVHSADENGSAWPYSEQWVPMPDSVEKHTTVSAHPFQVKLRPGEYEIEIERGKEYLPLREAVSIPPSSDPSKPIERSFRLRRWIDMSAQGWYSGETHVHRRFAELPNVMLAEDLNVAFPVTYWTTRSDQIPDLAPSPLRSQGPSPFGPRENHGHDPIWVSEQHVILPRNTEYEIFSIGQRRHVLGALFILNHRTPFTLTAPPVTPIVNQARAEGALLDLDKHNWPWSLMLVPVAQVDLYELSNNSVWRTNFGFKQAGHALPTWADIEQESPGVLTEWGWLQFGFEMYYALLNCGFRLSPTAGTASGVHPVPLGYSRVYVHTGEAFELEPWLTGLKHGRSFVTTGPMLLGTINRQHPGASIQFPSATGGDVEWSVTLQSPDPITQFELLFNGQVQQTYQPESKAVQQGGWFWKGNGKLTIPESGWVVMRAWSDQPDGRKRFAHTGAWYFEVAGRSIRPPRSQVEYLLEQLESSMQRQRDVLPPEAFAEFEQARDVYRSLLKNAR